MKVLIYFYLQSDFYTPEIVKEIKLAFPLLFVLVMSSMFIVESKRVKHINTSIMKECLNSGANRVCPKDIHEICDIIEKHLKIRNEK
jgi:hypothetical protein